MPNPYYVYAPPYIATSAGIRALYELCSLLNGRGLRAYMVTEPYLPNHYQVGPGLVAPLLTRQEAEAHRAGGLRPIVVYSETVQGDPLRARAVVRYIMNAPGLLGGPDRFDAREFLYAYSQALAAALGHPERSLFIPVIYPERFRPGPGPRSGVYVYAAKYRAVHGGELFGTPPDAIELTRDMVHSPDPDALLRILQSAKRLYVFENSAIVVEAALCGCPVVMMPNAHLRLSIGEWDHGHAGIAWGDSPEEIARAEATVGEARAGYQAAIDHLPESLDRFIASTQAYREGIEGFGVSLRPLRAPSYERLAAAAAGRLLRDRGAGALAGKVAALVRERGLYAAARIAVVYVAKALGGG